MPHMSVGQCHDSMAQYIFFLAFGGLALYSAQKSSKHTVHRVWKNVHFRMSLLAGLSPHSHARCKSVETAHATNIKSSHIWVWLSWLASLKYGTIKNSFLGSGMYGIQKSSVLHVVGFIAELSQFFYITPLKLPPVGVCSVHGLCQL